MGLDFIEWKIILICSFMFFFIKILGAFFFLRDEMEGNGLLLHAPFLQSRERDSG